MKVAIVAPPWVPVPPPRYGGTETVLDGLARGLRAAGHDVLLYATGDSTCPVDVRFTVPHATGIGAVPPTAELRHIVDAYGVAAGWGADIVHDHTVTGPLYGTVATPVPVVTTNHGPFTGGMAAFYRTMSRRVPIVAISRHHASTAVDTRIAAVIHHGIDVDQFVTGLGDGGYALFLGRMCADKGVDRAVAIARATGVPLRIAAKMREPEEKAYFRDVIAPTLGGDVEYLGEVDADDKLALLRGARCLLNPIAWPEPFGMVMIEALASGTPVIATPLGSVPEIVDDGVTGFVRRSQRALVGALGDIDSISRAACRAAAVARFSVERMTSDYVALYRTIIEQRQGAQPARSGA